MNWYVCIAVIALVAIGSTTPHRWLHDESFVFALGIAIGYIAHLTIKGRNL